MRATIMDAASIVNPVDDTSVARDDAGSNMPA